MSYYAEINKAKRDLNYYTQLQAAEDRRFQRAKWAKWLHYHKKAITAVCMLLFFVCIFLFIFTGVMWAEGAGIAVTNIICIVSFVLCFGAGVLAWACK